MFCAYCIITTSLIAQPKTRKFSTSINHPSINLYAPYLSADGTAIVFISDNAEDNALTPYYSFKENADWKEPKVLPKNIYSRSNFLNGYSLSADGKKMFLSSNKSPGLGGFDLWFSEWKGTAWSEPVNFGSPVNSKMHDVCPSVTTDGNTMYFMRCEKTDQNKSENCKLFSINKKSNGQWSDAIELPSNINTGNSQSPRIMADGETLIFSSNKLAQNKGGMDLYVSRLKDGNWSDPLSLDFVNTDKDDQYISVAALGRYLVRDSPGARKSEIVEYLIPDQFRPKGMMKIEGKVTDPSGASIPAYTAVLDLNSGKRVYNGRPGADGSFLLYLKEGSKYELSINPEQNNVSYFSKVFDLTIEKIPAAEKVKAILKPLSAGDELQPEMLKFITSSSEIDLLASINELNRLKRVITGNPDLKFEIQVLLSGYEEDSIQSESDLTEVIYDSIHTQYEDLDSLGQVYMRDTTLLKTIYHNDRTLKQSQAIVSYFVNQGVSHDRLTYFVNAIPATLPEDKKLTIKIVARKK